MTICIAKTTSRTKHLFASSSVLRLGSCCDDLWVNHLCSFLPTSRTLEIILETTRAWYQHSLNGRIANKTNSSVHDTMNRTHIIPEPIVQWIANSIAQFAANYNFSNKNRYYHLFLFRNCSLFPLCVSAVCLILHMKENFLFCVFCTKKTLCRR